MARKIKVFSGSFSKELTEKVCFNLGTNMGLSKKDIFSDGEFQPSYEENMRGCDVYLIQSCPPPIDNYWELFQMIQAAKLASAKSITVIIPYFGYARQDRKDKPRVPISAKLIAKFLESSGANRVLTIDIHSDQIQGFFDTAIVDLLFGTYVFWPYIENKIKEGIYQNLLFASADNGGTKRATRYADKFEVGYVICSKIRKKKNEVDSMRLVGDVKGKSVILVDDLVDTGGTLCKASDLMMENGAIDVRAICSHPVLSGKVLETIEKSSLKELIVLDTIPLKISSNKITVLSCSEMLATAIKKIDSKKSLSQLFLKK